MSKVALVIIYNHRYDKNIELLEQIYKNRFSNIYHLIPFYNGTRPNVIPVYDSSYYFQGYVAQGLKSYFREEYEHYFFVADDMILNPVVNETNYTQHLKLNPQTSFIPYLGNFHDIKGFWPRTNEAYHYNVNVRGVEAKNELPTYEAALQRFEQFGLSIKPLRFSQVWQIPTTRKALMKMLYRDTFLPVRFIAHKLMGKKYHLTYPLIGSYADIFVVSGATIKQFCHYCGAFAATRLFVESAIPTALVLSADEIVTERDLQLQGRPLWTPEDFTILDKYNNNIEHLLRDFPEGYLYLHPIKLSKWNKKS